MPKKNANLAEANPLRVRAHHSGGVLKISCFRLLRSDWIGKQCWVALINIILLKSSHATHQPKTMTLHGLVVLLIVPLQRKDC
jgi:hypothetical protein